MSASIISALIVERALFVIQLEDQNDQKKTETQPIRFLYMIPTYGSPPCPQSIIRLHPKENDIVPMRHFLQLNNHTRECSQALPVACAFLFFAMYPVGILKPMQKGLTEKCNRSKCSTGYGLRASGTLNITGCSARDSE